MMRIRRLEQRVRALEKILLGKQTRGVTERIRGVQEWIIDYLSQRPDKADLVHIVMMKAREAGIPAPVMRTARLEMEARVIAERVPGTKKWQWRLI